MGTIVLEKILIVAYFIPIMIVGIAGNLWVIISLLRILYKTWNPMNNVFKHMSFYILCLSVADLCVLFMTPAVTAYFVVGSWKFGYMGCKIFFAVENVNKLLSVAILTLMSIERWFVICRPFKWFCCRRKRVLSVLVIVLILLIIIFVLCWPIIKHSRTTEIVSISENGTHQFSATLCISALPDNLMSIFISYMFILGFVVPLTLISVCYFFLIRHLRKTDGQRLFVTKYTQQVIKSVLSVVCFHFLCWAPFWMFVILPLLSYFNLTEFAWLESDFSQTVRMISSFLPYLNSAGNWIFYSKAINHARSALISGNSRRYTMRKPRSLLSRLFATADTRV